MSDTNLLKQQQFHQIQMNSIGNSMLPFLAFLLFSFSRAASSHTNEDFVQCLSLYSENSTSISNITYTPNNSSYSSILQFSIRNLRFNTTSTPKPLFILTPWNASEIQAAVICSQKYGLQIRVRSGGHDFEGLSYVSSLPFVLIDLINLRKVTVDVENNTAWVQGGATLGELYYSIAEKSRTLAFPAGGCPTVGVGGHFSGGGFGILMRKYGIAADNIIDAHLVDVQGRILDRESMGEDLFWAIRGGGGNTFGIVVAWKVNLVPVPPIVTVCDVKKTLDQNATQLVHKWQYVANKVHEDLFIILFARRINSNRHEGNTTVQVSFDSLFLGRVDALLPLIQESFPELGLVKENCLEVSWIESILLFAGFPSNSSLDVLLDRTPPSVMKFKGKSDYVTEPIPEIGLEGIWKRLYEVEVQAGLLLFIPYGGKMDNISESSIPFPHRAGNIYKLPQMIFWSEEGDEAAQTHISWVRRLNRYLTPYVSKNPRASYVNYKDLDLGVNNLGNTSYRQAKVWGIKYFKNNFDKLVHVKTAVDPANFFRSEQTIPPLTTW